MATDPDLTLTSLRGGMNDEDPITSIAADECEIAENVEWFVSALGERRAGCAPFDLTSSGLTGQALLLYLCDWLPTNIVTLPEWWAVGATPGASIAFARHSSGVWASVSPDDAPISTAPNVFNMTAQSLNGKLFWSYPSAVDRLHVWDGTYLRRTGLAQPVAAPTAVDNGSGAYANVRYFRVRYIRMSGSTVLARSEPSAVLTFTPSGAGSGAVVTRPALLSEHETHWELEASTDNAKFYLIQTIAVATTTATDTTAYSVGYASSGALSEVIGTYLLQSSAKFLSVDGDRLLLGGHWTDTSLQSRVSWSPVFSDPGAGSDERLPLQINNTLDLDNYEGGPLTGMSNGINGTWFAFKWSHIYKMVRTGDINRAYDVLTVSKTRGAIPGSIFDGADENGAACVYFTDPILGPSRVGPGGLQLIKGLRQTWKRVNLNAANVICRGLYYPYKQQAHWWVAVDGADSPNLKLVLQISSVISGDTGSCHRGWSLATGRIAEAYTAAILSDITISDDVVTLSGYPFIGLTAPDFLQRCDVTTTDAGVPYLAFVRSAPIFPVGILNKWGAMVASILATQGAGSLTVRFIRDFGLETREVTINLTPTLDESYVIRALDNLAMAGATSLQIEFSDPS